MLSEHQLLALEACAAHGGIALFGADTVYGLACDAEDAEALARIYELKGRPAQQPAAVMFFDLEAALEALGDLGASTSRAVRALLPGALTLLLANPLQRYPLAGGKALGLRVPAPGESQTKRAFLQTSANRSGGAEAVRLQDVEQAIRSGVELVLDGGELAGSASTVVDLSSYEQDGEWRIVREGAVSAAEIARLLR